MKIPVDDDDSLATRWVVVAAVVVATMALTWLLGWWAVPLVGVAAGVWRGGRGARWPAALGAGLGWLLLLVFDAASGGGRFGALAAGLGGVFRLPAAGFMLVTVSFAALLAWSACVVAGALARAARRDEARALSSTPEP